jgi:WD40 repeat protein
LLAAVNSDGTINVWELTSGEMAFKLQNSGGETVAFSPDGHALAWVYGLQVNFVEAATGRDLSSLGLEDGVLSLLSFSADGETIALRLIRTCNIGLFQVSTFRKVGSVGNEECSSLFITDAAFSPDGTTIVSASYNADSNLVVQPALLQIWDTGTGQELHKISGHEANVTDIDFSPDGKVFVSGSSDGTVILWDVATGRPLYNFINTIYRP